MRVFLGCNKKEKEKKKRKKDAYDSSYACFGGERKHEKKMKHAYGLYACFRGCGRSRGERVLA